MVYVLKLSPFQRQKIDIHGFAEEVRCESLTEFVFKAHYVLQALWTAGFNTTDFMWYREVPTEGDERIVDVSKLKFSHIDAAKRNPHPPVEKDSGWG